MKNLHHIWIVADAVRAIDDQVAKALVGRSFRRRLIMDEKSDDDFITFLVTKTDQVNIQELINPLHLEESALSKELEKERELQAIIEEAEEEIKTMAQLQRNAAKTLRAINEEEKGMRDASGAGTKTKGRKRKFEETKEIDELPAPELDENRLEEIALERQKLVKARSKRQSNEKDLKSKINKAKKLLTTHKDSIRTICIVERNKYTEDHLQEDFEGGFLELEEELRQTDEATEANMTKRKGIISLSVP
jgi:hypothetical protein